MSAPAKHCEALVPPADSGADLDELVREFGRKFARELSAPLAEMIGGKRPQVSVSEVKRQDASTCVTQGEGPSAHFCLGDADGGYALTASLGGREALALCDHVFGGTGEVAEPLPECLPMSADLVLKRFGEVMAQAITRSQARAANITILARGETLAKLIPFARIAACFVIEIHIERPQGAPWALRLLGEARALDAWFGGSLASQTTPPSPGAAPADPGASPFADIPLPISAELAELRLPVSRVSQLRAGDTIALPMRREVPLRIGGKVIARGSIGTLDDRIALQICGGETFQTFQTGEPAS